MIWLLVILGVIVAIFAWAIAEELRDLARFLALVDDAIARINAPVVKD